MPSNAGADSFTVSMDEQMQAYDSLPSELKALYDSSPVALDAREFLLVHEKYGSASALLIERLIKQQYPEWTGIIARRRQR